MELFDVEPKYIFKIEQLANATKGEDYEHVKCAASASISGDQLLNGIKCWQNPSLNFQSLNLNERN